MATGTRNAGWIGQRQSVALATRTALFVTVTVEGWIERRRQRRSLLELNDHMLKDIGIGRGEAYREACKPFWRG